ncbi:MAG TPA: peptide deformylase [Candidatus Saccharimonadales bacterium]|nr:peptide deformylase [Candidatus Saccharimonadales bacterium]
MTNPKDQIITLPNPHLRQRSRKVGLVTGDVQKIITDMEAALVDWENSREHEVGVALAAIQIDQALRIVIIRSNHNNKEDKSFRVFINPVITKYEGPIETDHEGCLSIKDIYGLIPRYQKVRVKAQDTSGRSFRITAEGFQARTLQHEIDHTNGTLFVDHIKNNKKAFFILNKEGNLEQLDEKDIELSNIFR